MTMVEGLEGRRMLADTSLLRVGAVNADNRGSVVIRFSERAVGVRGGAAQMYTAGADKKLYTSDDKKENPRITYSTNKKELSIRANLKKDTPYRIKLDGKTRIRAQDDNALLDGEFSGKLASGNGKAGGNFEFATTRDRSSAPTVIVRTSAGDFTIKMAGDASVKQTVNNFLGYVNAKKYDSTVLHRNARTQSPPLGPLAILQGGGYTLDGSTFTHIATSDPIALEAGLPNVRGTISMARQSAPDTATSEFFLNTADNREILDANAFSAGYAVFGNISAGMDVVDAIYNSNTVAIGAFDAVPQYNSRVVTFNRVGIRMNLLAKG